MAKTAITDFGDKIGGARKDLFSRSYARSEFLGLPSKEREKLATRDKIWPKPNWKKRVADGDIEAEVAWAVSYLRALLPKTFNQLRDSGFGDAGFGDAAHAEFVEGIMLLRDKLAGVKTWDDLQREAEALNTRLDRSLERVLGSLSMNSREWASRPCFDRFGSGRYVTASECLARLADSADRRSDRVHNLARLARLHAFLGWPADARGWIGKFIRNHSHKIKFSEDGSVHLDERLWTTILERQLQDGTLEAIAGLGSEYLEAVRATSGSSTPGKLREVVREWGVPELPTATVQQLVVSTYGPKPKVSAKSSTVTRDNFAKSSYLGECQRVGRPDLRKSRDVEPEDFLETFGFRGGEFGNWVNQEERQLSLNHAYDALLDLADVLHIDPKGLSLSGTLAIAFGARGRGGWASAHYEPVYRVINLTKPSGAGALAHEWFHAFDHWLSGKVLENGEYLKADDLWSRRMEVGNGATQPVRRDTDRRPVKPPVPYTAATISSDEPAQRVRYGTSVLLATATCRLQTLDEYRHTIEDRLSNDRKKWKQWTDAMADWAGGVGTPEDVEYIRSLRTDPAKGGTEEGKNRLMTLRRTARRLRSRDSWNMDASNFTRNFSNFLSSRDYYARSFENFNRALKQEVVDYPGLVPTEFCKAAVEKDAKRSPKYWSTPVEILARTFESVVAEKLRQAGGRCDYLVRPDCVAPAYPDKEDVSVVVEAWDSYLAEAIPQALGSAPRIDEDVSETAERVRPEASSEITHFEVKPIRVTRL